MHGWPDQSGSQMVFFGQVSGEQKGGRKKWPLSSGVLDPWASLGSQSACAITCCLLHASWSAGQWDVFWGLSWTLALRLTSPPPPPPPLVFGSQIRRVLFLIFSLFSHSSISDFSTCFLYLLFLTFSNPSFLFSSPESSIFFIFLFFTSFPLCYSALCMCGRILNTAYQVCECATNLSSRCSIQRRIKESFHFSKINSFGQERKDAHQTGC